MRLWRNKTLAATSKTGVPKEATSEMKCNWDYPPS